VQTEHAVCRQSGSTNRYLENRMRLKRKQTEQELKSQSQAKREPPPVMGKNVLFISEESVGHVGNFHQSSDTDRQKKIRKIESQAPTVDPQEKWLGDGTSDR
jgi:hypothetical protein